MLEARTRYCLYHTASYAVHVQDREYERSRCGFCGEDEHALVGGLGVLGEWTAGLSMQVRDITRQNGGPSTKDLQSISHSFVTLYHAQGQGIAAATAVACALQEHPQRASSMHSSCRVNCKLHVDVQ